MDQDLLESLEFILEEHQDELNEKEVTFVSTIVEMLGNGEIPTDAQYRWAEDLVERHQS